MSNIVELRRWYTYLYFVFVRRKNTFICSVLYISDWSMFGGIRQRWWDRQEMAVLVKKIILSFFLPLYHAFRTPTLNPPLLVHLEKKRSWAWRKAVQMFIFYSFQVPVYFLCGVIWILTNLLACRKRVQVDGLGCGLKELHRTV